MTEKNTLAQAIENTMIALMEGIHTCLPGSIIDYDFKEARASVKPLIQKSYIDGDSMVLPIIRDVPVIFPRTGVSGITFPLNKGDKVLIVFSERSLDNWKGIGDDAVPRDFRKFDLSDAVCIPGLYSFNTRNLAKNNKDLVIHHNGFTITITDTGKISLKGANGLDLLKIIDDWMEQIQQSTVITGIGLQPFDPVSLTAMAAIQLQLQELLE